MAAEWRTRVGDSVPHSCGSVRFDGLLWSEDQVQAFDPRTGGPGTRVGGLPAAPVPASFITKMLAFASEWTPRTLRRGVLHGRTTINTALELLTPC
jgi:hypothetical protein